MPDHRSSALPPGTDRAGTELEPTAGELRQRFDQVVERLIAYLDGLPAAPTRDLAGAEELARELDEPLPESATPLGDLLAPLFERWIPKSFNTVSPGFLAYIPGGGLVDAAIGDLIASVTNRYTTVWEAAPALAQLETAVIRWFADILGLPGSTRGFLTTGGSLANLTALVTARSEKLGEDFLDGTLYVSDQVHHSVTKAARLAGLRPSHVRAIATDEGYRMRIDDLERAIEADRSAGRRPFLVVGSAGTTNTGAVDDLTAIAAAAERHGLWLHVDAAYGGFFCLTERGKATLAGIGRADSISVDPHKSLFLPYGTGALLVRDGEALERSHASGADYMPSLQADRDRVDFCQISPELSRDFRGLRIWLPLKLHGAGAFRRALDEKLDLARWATERLRRVPDVEILAEPQLTVTAFRLAPAGIADAELDPLNQRWLEAVNRRQRVFLTATRLRGRFALRVCVLSLRTHQDRMETALEDIEAAREEVLAG